MNAVMGGAHSNYQNLTSINSMMPPHDVVFLVDYITD
jgi:hypothetical protein